MIEYKGIRWNLYHGMLTPQVPPHVELGIDVSSAKQLMAQSHAWLVRWTSDFDCKTKTEWWYIIKDGQVNLEELDKNTRKQIRSGLRQCYAKKVDADVIAQQGYPVYLKSFAKYKTRTKPVSESSFREAMMLEGQKKVREFWGVFERATNKLIGYSVHRYQYNCCEYLEVKYDHEYLSKHSSIALIYERNLYYLNELGALYVSEGQRVISHETQLQEFLITKFGCRQAYCRLNIVYSPLMRMIVNMFFPFRSFVSPLNEDLSTILKQEEIRRSFSNQGRRLG